MSEEKPDLLSQLFEMRRLGIAKNRVVLSSKNDPFWTPPSRVRDAKWIANVWRERINKTTYNRGVHYMLISWNIQCPWGVNRIVHLSPSYMNVTSDYNHLCLATRDARNWGLLPWSAIEDHRSVGLEKWVNYALYYRCVECGDVSRESFCKKCDKETEPLKELLPFENFDNFISHELDLHIPEIYELGSAMIYDDVFDDIKDEIVSDVLDKQMTDLTPARYQPYYCCVVSEKSGLREPIWNSLEKLSYGFDFLNFTGQSSSTIMKSFIENRLLSNIPPENPLHKKKIRIFYISDYDNAGKTMVPAFIQKLIFNLWTLNLNLDLKIKPLALTKEIVEKYDLPPAPVPIRTLGQKTLQDRWLRKFGKIVEVDALEALHPGVLETIIVDELGKFIDLDLAEAIQEKLDEIKNDSETAIREALDEKYDDWIQSKTKLEEAMGKMNEAMDRLQISETLQKLKVEMDKISEEYAIEELVVDYQKIFNDVVIFYNPPAELNLESTYEAEEGKDWLYDSKRDPNQQAKLLREFKP